MIGPSIIANDLNPPEQIAIAKKGVIEWRHHKYRYTQSISTDILGSDARPNIVLGYTQTTIPPPSGQIGGSETVETKRIIMKLIYPIVCGFLLLILLQTSSCNRYVDSVTGKKKERIQGNMTFYPDSNVLVYRNGVTLRMDTEVLKPKPFFAKFPKGIKWYEMTNSQAFLFYYSHQQVIYINIDLSNKSFSRDTMYEPTKSELDDLLNSVTSNHNKYDLRKIKLDPRRKNNIIKNGAATILLYNIAHENFDTFREYMKEFRFL